MIRVKKNSLLTSIILFFTMPLWSVAQQSYLMNQKVFNQVELNYGSGVVIRNNNFLIAGTDMASDTCTNYYLGTISNDSITDTLLFYGGSNIETLNSIISLDDTGFLLAGSSSSDDGNLTANFGLGDCWLVRTDTAGNILWQQNYGGSAYDVANAVASLPQGGYVVVGSTRSNDGLVSFNHGESDLWLFRIDEEGSLLWEKSLGGSESDNGKSLLVLNDSLVMIIGTTKSSDGDVAVNHGKSDYWLIQYNLKGDSIVWEKTYGEEDSDAGTDMVYAHDGGYILAGNSRTRENGGNNNGQNDYRIMKVSSTGKVMWDHSFGGSLDEIATDILRADGEGYLISGYTYSQDGDVEGNHGGRDMWIIKLNNDGKLIWQRALGGMYHEVANGAALCRDGGYRVVGYTVSSDGDIQGHLYRKMDTWSVKLCEENIVKEFVNICEGQSYKWQGDTYYEEGTYEKHFVNRCGFDSIRQLKLKINNYPDNFEIEGEAEPYFGKPFTYTAPLLYQNVYHWFPVNGIVVDTPAFNQISVAWGAGGEGILKAVAERPGGCTSDTAYFEVTIVGEAVQEIKTEPVLVYPVPATEFITVEGKNLIKTELYNLNGDMVKSVVNQKHSGRIEISVSELPSGVYYVQVFTRDFSIFKKIIKM